jgi:cytochrome P450
MGNKTIPTLRGHWLLGSGREMVENPAEFMLWLAQNYGDIAHFRLLHMGFYLVASPAYIQEVLVSQADKFQKSRRDKAILSRFLGNGILVSDGAYHKRQRRLVQPAFHTTRIQAYATTMVEYTLRMLASWSDGSEQAVDVAMRDLTMEIVGKSLFDADVTGDAGLIGEAIETLQQVAGYDFRTQNMIPAWLPLARNQQRTQANNTLDRVIKRIIQERRSTDEDKGDLLSMLLLSETEDGTRMTDQEVRDEAVTLFAAGHETTSNALAWTWYLLAQHPEAEARLHDEVDRVLGRRPATLNDLPQLTYTSMVVKEALRLYPPAWVLNAREAIADVEIDGYVLPRGSRVFISPYAVHRNPRYFDHPLQFDPERFHPQVEKNIPRYSYFPFGGGPRVCIGNSFAMLEAQLIVATMAQHYRLALLPGQTIETDPLITMGPKTSLRMRTLARQTAEQTAG